jgi:ketosteroid isomerase-like protein
MQGLGAILRPMPQSSSEVVRAYFLAMQSGSVDAVARYWDPDVEWRAVAGAADDVGVIRGPEELRAYLEDWLETLADLRAEVEEVLYEDGERVAAVVRNAGRGRASGVPVQGRYYVACVVRDGRIVSGREFGTREEAVEGVGHL